MNWRAARDQAHRINKELAERRTAGAGAMKFERVWREWFATREEDCDLGHQRRATLQNIKSKSKYVLEEFGRKKMNWIFSIDVERWAKRLAARFSPQMGSGCAQQVGQVLTYAVRKRYLAFNSLRQDPIKLRLPPCDRQWVPTWNEVERLIEHGRRPRPGKMSRIGWSNMKIAIAVSAGAGLRFGELAALKWSSIDFVEGVVLVREQFTVADGLHDPKTPWSKRDVPMSQWVYEALLDHAHVLKTCGRSSTEGFIIRHRDRDDQPILLTSWEGVFKKFLVDAGLEPAGTGRSHWRWHVLRRFYISARLALGDNLMEVGEAVAHRDPSMTAKTYARALPANPLAIWCHRFKPADPAAPIIIDGAPMHVIELLPPHSAANAGTTAPEWLYEAVRLLEGGWRIADVLKAIGKGRAMLNQRLSEIGLPGAHRIYRDARDRRYEELDAQGYGPRDIADMTGTSLNSYYHWRSTHEAGVPNDRKYLKELGISAKRRRSGTTERQQKQLDLL